MLRPLLAAMVLTLVTGCGSDEPATRDVAARTTVTTLAAPTTVTTAETSTTSSPSSSVPVLDPISYDGTLVSGTGPGAEQPQPVGIFCTGDAGEECNLTGLSVGNHDVVTLTRVGPGSFTVDLPSKPSTCTMRGTSAVTGTINLDGRSMAMTLQVTGETVSCPDGDITYEPSMVTFQGEYVGGGLPGFTVG